MQQAQPGTGAGNWIFDARRTFPPLCGAGPRLLLPDTVFGRAASILPRRLPDEPAGFEVWCPWRNAELHVMAEYAAAESEFMARWDFLQTTSVDWRPYLKDAAFYTEIFVSTAKVPPVRRVKGRSNLEHLRAQHVYAVWAAFTRAFFLGVQPPPPPFAGGQPGDGAALANLRQVATWLHRMVGECGLREDGRAHTAVRQWVEAYLARMRGEHPDVFEEVERDWQRDDVLRCKVVGRHLEPSGPSFVPVYPKRVTGGFGRNRYSLTKKARIPVQGLCGVPADFSGVRNFALGFLSVSQVTEAVHQAAETAFGACPQRYQAAMKFFVSDILRMRDGQAEAPGGGGAADPAPAVVRLVLKTVGVCAKRWAWALDAMSEYVAALSGMPEPVAGGGLLMPQDLDLPMPLTADFQQLLQQQQEEKEEQEEGEEEEEEEQQQQQEEEEEDHVPLGAMEEIENLQERFNNNEELQDLLLVAEAIPQQQQPRQQWFEQEHQEGQVPPGAVEEMEDLQEQLNNNEELQDLLLAEANMQQQQGQQQQLAQPSAQLAQPLSPPPGQQPAPQLEPRQQLKRQEEQGQGLQRHKKPRQPQPPPPPRSSAQSGSAAAGAAAPAAASGPAAAPLGGGAVAPEAAYQGAMGGPLPGGGWVETTEGCRVGGSGAGTSGVGAGPTFIAQTSVDVERIDLRKGLEARSPQATARCQANGAYTLRRGADCVPVSPTPKSLDSALTSIPAQAAAAAAAAAEQLQMWAAAPAPTLAAAADLRPPAMAAAGVKWTRGKSTATFLAPGLQTAIALHNTNSVVLRGGGSGSTGWSQQPLQSATPATPTVQCPAPPQPLIPAAAPAARDPAPRTQPMAVGVVPSVPQPHGEMLEGVGGGGLADEDRVFQEWLTSILEADGPGLASLGFPPQEPRGLSTGGTGDAGVGGGAAATAAAPHTYAGGAAGRGGYDFHDPLDCDLGLAATRASDDDGSLSWLSHNSRNEDPRPSHLAGAAAATSALGICIGDGGVAGAAGLTVEPPSDPSNLQPPDLATLKALPCDGCDWDYMLND